MIDVLELRREPFEFRRTRQARFTRRVETRAWPGQVKHFPLQFSHNMAASSTHSLEETESFLSVTEDLVPSLPPNLPTTTTLDFSGLLTPPLILQTDLKEGCGGQLWPAGRVLAKYLIQCKMDGLRGKTMFVRSNNFLPLREMVSNGGMNAIGKPINECPAFTNF